MKEGGVIKSVDMTAHTLVVTEHKNHADQTFQWNDQTKFRERDKNASPTDLKPGERVHLSYTAGGSTPTCKPSISLPSKQQSTPPEICHTPASKDA